MKDAHEEHRWRTVVVIALVAMIDSRAVAATVPNGFEIVTFGPAFNAPTSMAFASGTRIFVTEQSGMVRVVENGSLRPQPFIDLTEEVNGQGDRGLLGMALDPNFAVNRHVYLCYTVDPFAGARRMNRAAPPPSRASPDTRARPRAAGGWPIRPRGWC